MNQASRVRDAPLERYAPSCTLVHIHTTRFALCIARSEIFIVYTERQRDVVRCTYYPVSHYRVWYSYGAKFGRDAAASPTRR